MATVPSVHCTGLLRNYTSLQHKKLQYQTMQYSTAAQHRSKLILLLKIFLRKKCIQYIFLQQNWKCQQAQRNPTKSMKSPKFQMSAGGVNCHHPLWFFFKNPNYHIHGGLQQLHSINREIKQFTIHHFSQQSTFKLLIFEIFKEYFKI